MRLLTLVETKHGMDLFCEGVGRKKSAITAISISIPAAIVLISISGYILLLKRRHNKAKGNWVAWLYISPHIYRSNLGSGLTLLKGMENHCFVSYSYR